MTKSALETFKEMPAPGSWLHQVEEGSFEDVQLKGTDCLIHIIKPAVPSRQPEQPF